jgi:hypothetical protein
MIKDNTLPLMPKATAVWLIDNTSLSFDQIAEFCGLHPLEVQAIADGESARGIVGVNPILSGQITQADLKRAESNPNLPLKLSKDAEKHNKAALKERSKGKYVPIARRQDKPDAIAWLLQNRPELSDNQIIKLVGTTKTTIDAVRNKEHWNSPNIRPRDPVLIGLCSQTQLDHICSAAHKRVEEQKKREEAQAQKLAKAEVEKLKNLG